VRGFVGDGAANLVRRCVLAAGGIPGPGQLERFLADYLEHPCDSTVVHPPALREFLAGWEGPMAVVTNKPEAITRRVLALLGIDRYFGAVVGGDTTPERKPAPGPLREALHRLGATTGVMVGDGPQDVYAGHAAGLVVVGVSWGIGVPAGADHVVNDVPALAERLRSIIMGGCVSSP
jgi:phosphoglycolate phosphatase